MERMGDFSWRPELYLLPVVPFRYGFRFLGQRILLGDLDVHQGSALKRSDKIKEMLRRPRPREELTPDRFLSSGSTLLNLACTGRPDGAFLKGHYYHFVGDSQSGKTFFTLSCLAEACRSPAFDEYRLIYDDTEGGALMDVERFFGAKAAARIEPPGWNADGSPQYSRTVEEYYYHVDDALKVGRPFVYVLDSQDGLTSKAERDKFQKNKRAVRKEAPDAAGPTGSYGDGKAKAHSSDLRQLIRPLQDTGSILMIVNQTRDSFDLFEKSCYSGGRALLFYATLQLWSRLDGAIVRTVAGKKRQVGNWCRVRVKKNRVLGQDRTVRVPILLSHGIDETGSLIEYLIDEGCWREEAGVVTVTGLGPEFAMRREALAQKIEDGDLTDDVRELVVLKWSEVEAACEVKRRARYE